MYTKEIASTLQKGGIGVMMTDTIYGILGTALSSHTVDIIFKIKNRNPKKPPIILLNSQDQLKLFGIHLDKKTREILSCLWPRKVSIILPCALKKFRYLHKGKGTLAFRVPAKKSLRDLLKITGPLIAPSANLEGMSPAQSQKEAKEYFGSAVDFYKGSVNKEILPSTLISLRDGKYIIIRKGAVSEKKISLCV